MSDQENVPPATRLPRLATPTKASSARSIPVLSAATTVAGKRKMPQAAEPPAKRVASNPKPTRPATRSSTGAREGMTTRRSSGASGTSGTSASTSGSTRTTATRKPPVPRVGARLPTAVPKPAPKPAARPAPKVAARAPVKPPVPRAGAARPVRPGARAEPLPEDNRMAKMEEMLGHLQEETAKISASQKTEEERQAQARAAEAAALEARRDLSNAAEEKRAMIAQHAREVEDRDHTIRRKEELIAQLKDELAEGAAKLMEAREENRLLKQESKNIAEQQTTLTSRLTTAEIRIKHLEDEIDRSTIAVSAAKAEAERMVEAANKERDAYKLNVDEMVAECDKRVAAMEAECRAGETIRRKLHNMVQELKGNIRVFARVRPPLAHELNNPDGLANITYGDERLAEETGQSHLTVVSRSESAMGKEREQVNMFTFDRIFQPKHGQQSVFEEISMLAQSVLDGYNVCIFAYGQTGSGKSWTMEGGDTLDTQGMIPRAIDMIFNVSKQLRDRGWTYTMEGTFLEVYNDVINDLLGSSQFDSKKHEIKIDKDNRMTVTDVVSLPLSEPNQVSALLERARSRRAVAATLMNERSSRSHSVFALKVKGVNTDTDEKCEGILNLVDLAGSERLATSGAGENKERLKETININKSLSALADVIGALGNGQQGGHVPYRNSTLTRLLQTSLSGSSKTLMLCNLSPLAAHLGETVCTLRFATKVNSTPAGTARKSVSKA